MSGVPVVAWSGEAGWRGDVVVGGCDAGGDLVEDDGLVDLLGMWGVASAVASLLGDDAAMVVRQGGDGRGIAGVGLLGDLVHAGAGSALARVDHAGGFDHGPAGLGVEHTELALRSVDRR